MIAETGSSERKRKRVALLGIYHESNTFIKTPTTLQDFANSHWLKGEAIRSEYRDAFHEIGGMLEVLDSHEVEVVPVMFAEATPGGIIEKAAYHRLLQDMMEGLRQALPVDGCMVIPHGAGVAEGYPDMDGHWLGELRRLLGDHIPVIGTLDPHANGSAAMIAATDALVSYKTNPHIDQRATGKAAATLMVRTLNSEITPVQALAQVPVAISIEQQYTAAEPCRGLLALAAQIERRAGILSASLLLGFPYADVAEMGSSFIVVSDNDATAASAAAETLRSALMNVRQQCTGEKKTIYDLLHHIGDMPKPVLLLDMGDNIGGGSEGSSALLLKALEEDGRYRSFVSIYDPEATQQARSRRTGEQFPLQFGNETGLPGGPPYSGRVQLKSIADGKFRETHPRHGGQVNYDMGPIALVETANGNTVMLSSLRVPPFSLSQLTTFGIRPEAYEVIVAKGVNAPIAAYGAVCPTRIQVNTPGVTQADMTLFHYANKRKPLFPFELL